MEINLEYRKGSGSEIVTHIVKKFVKLYGNGNTGLFLIRESEITNEDGTKNDQIDVFGISFIASCKIDKIDSPLVTAFYVDQGDLLSYVLSPLPSGMANCGDTMFLLDYEGYLRICDYTGEKKMSIPEYYESKKNDEIKANTLERIGEEFTVINPES